MEEMESTAEDGRGRGRADGGLDARSSGGTADDPSRETSPADDSSHETPPADDPLADRYRRHTYRCLDRADEPVPVAELARQVVSRTAEKPPDTVSLDEQKHMYTALLRTHLPALEAAGLVERDRVEDTVVRTDGPAD